MNCKLLCKNCEQEVTKDTTSSIWEYSYECTECDENFFEFELIRKDKKWLKTKNKLIGLWVKLVK